MNSTLNFFEQREHSNFMIEYLTRLQKLLDGEGLDATVMVIHGDIEVSCSPEDKEVVKSFVAQAMAIGCKTIQ